MTFSKSLFSKQALLLPVAAALLGLLPAKASLALSDSLEPPMRYAVVLLSMRACCPDRFWAEAELKVEGELKANGFQIDKIDGEAVGEQDLRLSLVRLTKKRNAVFAVMILKAKFGVDIWISDRLTERVIVRRFPIDDENQVDVAALVGLKTVEALQSSYLEIVRLAPAEMQAKIPKEVRAVAARRADEESGGKKTQAPPPRSFLGVGMGGGAMGSPKSLGVQAFGELSLRGNPLPYLALELSFALAGLVREVSVRNAVSTFRSFPVRGFLLYTPFHRNRIRPVVGVGGGVWLVQTTAVGTFPYEGKSENIAVGTLCGTAQLVVEASRHVWIRAGFRAGALFPEVKLSFAGYPVGTYGPLVLEGFLHLEARFFWPASP